MVLKYILGFFVLLTISVFVYWCLVPPRWRSLFLLMCSLLFAASFSIPHIFYFLFNTIVVYIAGVFINKKHKSSRLLIRLVLIWLIGNLCFLKYTGILFKTSFWFIWFPKIDFSTILLPLGISFITFRLIHYIIEVYRGDIVETSFASFLLYVLFFPTFLAGPVERFQRFYPQTKEKKDIDIYNINYGLFRIILGVIKKAFIADNLARLIMPVLRSPAGYTRMVVICSVYGLAIQIYLDFSGYTDIAIGTARLFGYKIMENFNKPFLQKNVAFFYRNWHISLYSWIRDYFFLPVFGYKASRSKLYVGIIATMLVFNLWHNASLGFLIASIYTGLGILIWRLFQEFKKRYTWLRNLVYHKWLDLFSTFFTFNFFSFSCLFCFVEVKNLPHIIKLIFM